MQGFYFRNLHKHGEGFYWNLFCKKYQLLLALGAAAYFCNYNDAAFYGALVLVFATINRLQFIPQFTFCLLKFVLQKQLLC